MSLKSGRVLDGLSLSLLVVQGCFDARLVWGKLQLSKVWFESVLKFSPLTNCIQQEAGESREDSPAKTASFFSEICGSGDYNQKIVQCVTDAISNIVEKVQVVLVYWEKKYKSIWETDKDAYMRFSFYSRLRAFTIPSLGPQIGLISYSWDSLNLFSCFVASL